MSKKKKSNNYQPSNIPVLFFDGGSRGNPGKAAGAAVILMPDGVCHSVSEFLDFATNNEAEYTGLIVGLQEAKALGLQELQVKGDSNLVVNQVNGVWKINSDRLRSLCNQARSLSRSFQKVTINWIPRDQNKLADAAANQCMNQGFGSSNSFQRQKKTPVAENISSEIEPAIANTPAGIEPTIAQIIKL
ncbi:MAG: ribonuclease HI family protein [Gomphosphaeria aponina SAG 52.96 = DSM 107014]|uniref:Ribonuclease HI family protein n=1 Tax=Gomphosphaeria aponina SAG 52.96 = DSM 107014 TaxID=1521640 RepID=A0A941GV29_9CHRO|nr:ribonuclease HI family protein [Gomphosphaeria aponina SAG 52.96 = DSM 107014]